MKPVLNPQGDPIVAQSTPRGYSGVGVIRLSGAGVLDVLKRVFRPRYGEAEFPNRRVVYGEFVDPETEKSLDDGLAIFMQGPSTYTGEDVVEISLHGSPAVLDNALRIIVGQGARPAKKGEFTRRAFLAGALDLVQAEAVIDLIEAESIEAAQEARARLDATLSRDILSLAHSVKDLLADVEAHIDFDEDDEWTPPDPAPSLTKILDTMEELKQGAIAAKRVRRGITAVIVGKPNVGKSALFNALLRMDRTIVSPFPGTTRDSVDERMTFGGVNLTICDTAGVRDDPEPIEGEGIRRTIQRIKDADLLIPVFEACAIMDEDDKVVLDLCSGKETLVVLNKVDLGRRSDFDELSGAQPREEHLFTSALTGEGLDELRESIAKAAESKTAKSESDAVGGLTQRGLLLLQEAEPHISALVEAYGRGESPAEEIVSLELRTALAALQEITGERVDEGVLDRIFERFCVGK